MKKFWESFKRGLSLFVVMQMLLALLPVNLAFAADTGFRSPTDSHMPNGGWSHVNDALTSDNEYAKANAKETNGYEQGYSNFGFSIPVGSQIDGIEVLVDAKADDSACQLGVSLSYNDGTDWVSYKIQSIGESESTYTYGGSSDTWGRSWNLNDFTDTNFILKIKAVDPGEGCRSEDKLYVDWIRTKVFYSAATYSVDFHENDGSTVTDLTGLHYGDFVPVPDAPTKADYTFVGWYTDTALTNAWNFATDTITGNLDLYAKWEAVAPPAEDVPTAPVLFSPTNGQYFNTSPILNDWTAATDADGICQYQIEYVYDDGHTFSGAPYRYTDGSTTYRYHSPGLWEQGGVSVRVRAMDCENNWGDWSNTVHYYYDATAPSVPVHVSPADGVYLRTVDLSLIDWKDSTDNVPGPITYQYQSAYDSGFSSLAYTSTWLTNSQIPAGGTPEGVYYWHVRAKDSAGNVSDWSNPWIIHVDNTPPTADINFYLGTGAAATGFKVVFSEDVKEAEAENPANYYLTNWPDYAASSGDLMGDASIVYDSGTHTATVTFTNPGWYVSPEQLWGVQNVHDLAGNLQAVNPYQEYSTPLVAPVTGAFLTGTLGLGGIYTSDVAVNLVAFDPAIGSGVKTTFYSTDGLIFISGNDFTLSRNGLNEYWFYSVDWAGNVEDTKYGFLTIDKKAPVLTLVGSNPLNLTVGASFTDPGATALDNEDGDITNKIVVSGDTVNPNSVGTYIIRYNVSDSAGNAATEVTRTVNILPLPLIPPAPLTPPVAASVALAATPAAAAVLGETAQAPQTTTEVTEETPGEVKGSSNEACPWWWIIALILIIVLAFVGGVVRSAKEEGFWRKYYYLWPPVLALVAWIAHKILQDGLSATWFCNNYWLVMLFVAVVGELVFSYLVSRRK